MKKLYQRILSMALSVSMLLSMAVTAGAVEDSATQLANNQTKWTDEGNYDKALYDSGAGNWVINDAADLAAFAKKVNDGSTFEGMTVTLGQNIDLTGHIWVPIGGIDYANGEFYNFSGVFDGAGYQITGMSITGEVPAYAGLFGRVTGESSALRDFTVSGEISGSVLRRTYPVQSGSQTINMTIYNAVGGICGYLTGSATNIVSRVDLSLTSKTNMKNTAVGGAFGELAIRETVSRQIRNLGEVVVTITAVDDQIAEYAGTPDIGGLVGCLNGNCGSSGGLFDSYNAGNVTVTSNTKYVYAFGILGGTTSNIRMINCYNQGDVQSNSTYDGSKGMGKVYAAGIMHDPDAMYLYNLYNSGRAWISRVGWEEADYCASQLTSEAGTDASATLVNCFFSSMGTAWGRYNVSKIKGPVAQFQQGSCTISGEPIVGSVSDSSIINLMNDWVKENSKYQLSSWIIGEDGLPALGFESGVEAGNYSITVDQSIQNGSLTVEVPEERVPGTANEGDTITVTPHPYTNFTLVANSLKANGTVLTAGSAGDYSFEMPAENVFLTAQFEDTSNNITLTGENAEAANVSLDHEKALAGELVTLEVNITARGYAASPEVTYQDDTGKTCELAVTKAKKEDSFAAADIYTFTMPDADVTVDVNVEKVPGYDSIFTTREVNGEFVQSLQPGVYAIEYAVWNAGMSIGAQFSMADGAKVNPMYLEVDAEGNHTYYMTLQWLKQSGLRGHLLELWNIPATFTRGQAPSSANQYRNDFTDDYALSKDGQALKADVVQYIYEQGGTVDEEAVEIFNWAMGSYPRVYQFTRTNADRQNDQFTNELEDTIYFYVHVDAMEGSNQQAVLEFNWDTIRKLDSLPNFSVDTSGMNATVQGAGYRQPVESDEPPKDPSVPGVALPDGTTAEISKLTSGDEYNQAVAAVGGASSVKAVLKATVSGTAFEQLKLYLQVGQGNVKKSDYAGGELSSEFKEAVAAMLETYRDLKLYYVNDADVRLLAADLTAATGTAPIVLSAEIPGSGIYVLTTADVEGADKPEYQIMAVQSEHGVIEADQSAAKAGETVTVTFRPEPQHELLVAYMNGTRLQVENNTATFEMPASRAVITATFEEDLDAKTYEISVDVGITNGTVEANKTVAYPGTEIILTVTPANGYSVERVAYNNTTITPVDGAYRFYMPEANVTIAATFKKDGGTTPGGNPGGETENRYYTVEINLWHATQDKASMGNVAFDNNRMAIYDKKTGKLQIASNPVTVSGYHSAIEGIRYKNDSGEYVSVIPLDTAQCTPNGKWEGITTPFDYLRLFEFAIPEYLTGEGTEYVDLKIKVPYTPMDDVVVGSDGYLDARLKIDWSTLQSTDDSELDPDDDPATGTSSITGEEIVDVDLTDKDTGIKLSTDSERLSNEATLSVEKLTSGSDYDTAVKAMTGITDSWSLYNITALVDGAVTAPEGSVTISIPCTADGLTVYRINAGGTKTVLKGEVKDGYYVLNTSSLGLFAIVGVLGEARELPFTDVEAGSWYYDGVKYAVEKGLFTGTSATTFAPNMELTRSMLVTVLYRLAGSPEVSQSGQFSDVQVDSWYEDAVTWAAANGVVAGYGGGVFGPDDDITREQLALILYRYAQLTEQDVDTETDLTAYSDAGEVSDFAREAMAWAVENGLINGTSKTTLSPKGTATRAQVAVILMRYLEQLNK